MVKKFMSVEYQIYDLAYRKQINSSLKKLLEHHAYVVVLEVTFGSLSVIHVSNKSMLPKCIGTHTKVPNPVSVLLKFMNFI